MIGGGIFEKGMRICGEGGEGGGGGGGGGRGDGGGWEEGRG